MRRRLRYNLRKVIYRDDGLAPRPLDLAPMWTAGGGSAFSWTINAPITETVPEVDSGFPLPTYSAAGLPVGVAFDNFTRQLTGTPTALGTGTIVITAINNLGSDTYSYDFSSWRGPGVAELGLGNRRQRSHGQVNSPIPDQSLVPEVDTGFPAPTYSASGLPTGISFRCKHAPANRHGTPTVLGTGTITITATNSEGSDTYRLRLTLCR